MELFDGYVVTWILMPILIFLARVADVTLGTLRIVFVSKGFKILAPILGFFEILIWLIAMSKIFQNLDIWLYYIAYAGGFALGNYVGLIIEEHIAIGFVSLKIITSTSGDALAKKLINEGYGITIHEALGARGVVNIIYCVLKRSDYKKVTNLILEYNPNAFFTIEDIKHTNSGVYPLDSAMKSDNISITRLGK